MRIKLVFPGRKMRRLEIRSKNHLIPSETLAALVAVTPPQHEVTIEDENVQRLHLDDQPDVVGITVYTFLARRAYEIADHAHHHLICRECGESLEIDHDLLDELYHKLFAHTGYKIDSLHMTFFGTCPECQI